MFMELKECSDFSGLRSQFLINWISEMLTGIAKVNTGEYEYVCSVWGGGEVRVFCTIAETGRIGCDL